MRLGVVRWMATLRVCGGQLATRLSEEKLENPRFRFAGWGIPEAKGVVPQANRRVCTLAMRLFGYDGWLWPSVVLFGVLKE